MKPNLKVVYFVVGTLTFVVVSYASMLGYCAVTLNTPPEDVLTAFKDLGIFCSGALAALLARTGSSTEEPAVDVKVVNPETQPVPTVDKKTQ